MIVKFLPYVLHMYCTILNFYIAGGEKRNARPRELFLERCIIVIIVINLNIC